MSTGRTVLLIEDNEQNRYLATFLLERNGYRVVSADDGVSGVEMARKMVPAIILLDIQLPGQDGYGVARALRRNAALDAVPIVAVTSYAMPGDREKALAAGCAGYIEKPIDPDTFADEIARFLPAEDAMTHILAVDDKEQNLYYLSVLLGSRGHTVTTARNGAEALEAAGTAPPSLVISDLLMPVMDGYTLLRRWKQDGTLQAIPFVVYTATYTESEDAELAISLGADAFIVKPVEPDELLTRIEGVLSRRTAGTVPAALSGDEDTVLQRYNEALVRKLEQKMFQLEDANRALQRQMAERAELAMTQRAILDALPADVALVDPRGTILEVNERWKRFDAPSGLRSRAGVGTDYLAVCMRAADDSATSAAEAAEGIRNVLTGAAAEFALEYRCTVGGSKRWYRLTATPLCDALSTRAVVMHIDITERLKLEERLAQAQKLQAVGQLTGGVAHDFNNLLGVISGNLEFLGEHLADRPQLAEMLRDALAATERGAALTGSLLSFSRQQPLDPHPIDPNGLLGNMAALLRRTLRGDIELTLQTASTWLCEVDAGQLQNAVLNLVVNARDAMPQGGRLLIETADAVLDADYAAANAEVAAGDYVAIAVSDTGTGMPPELVARVFEPFFTTKEVGKGTGLGLSMVYGFVRQSLGHIRIYSEPGMGTAVRIYLPRSSGVAAAEPAPAPDMPEGKGEAVLVVEDDDSMRKLTVGMLKALGYRAVVATSGAEALERLREGRAVRVLLTDVVLPGGMNGRALAAAAVRDHPEIEVLYMSGYTENALVHHGRLDPGVNLLHKPFSRRKLATKLRRVLDGKAAP